MALDGFSIFARVLHNKEHGGNVTVTGASPVAGTNEVDPDRLETHERSQRGWETSGSIGDGFLWDMGASVDVCAVALLDGEIDDSNAASRFRWSGATDDVHSSIVWNTGEIAGRSLDLWDHALGRPKVFDWWFQNDISTATGWVEPSRVASDPDTVALRSIRWLGEAVAAPASPGGYWAGSVMAAGVEPFAFPLAKTAATAGPHTVEPVEVQEGGAGLMVAWTTTCNGDQRDAMLALYAKVLTEQPIMVLPNAADAKGKSGSTASFSATRRDERGGVMQFVQKPTFKRVIADTPGGANEWNVGIGVVDWQPKPQESSR